MNASLAKHGLRSIKTSRKAPPTQESQQSPTTIRREQIIFDVAMKAYGDLAEAARILNLDGVLSQRQKNACLKEVSAGMWKLGDIREPCLGRLSPKEYLKRR
jgi:hypothetical protein